MDLPKTKTQIAEELGISLSTLQRWLKKHDLHIPRGLISPEKQKKIYKVLGYEKRE